MNLALALVVLIGVIAVTIILFSSPAGTSTEDKPRRRVGQETRHPAQQPWDNADGRGNR